MPLQAMLTKLDNGRIVPVVRVPPHSSLLGLTPALNIPISTGSIALVGGAGAFDQPEYALVRTRVTDLLREMAQLAMVYNLSIVDGGTQFGVMRLMGDICRDHHYRFPLVGVAPSGVVIWSGNQGIDYGATWYGKAFNIQEYLAQKAQPQATQEPVPLDDNHSAFVLVQANEWGDEVEMLAATAHELANGGRAVEVLINGGVVARRDVTAYLQHGGEVIVVEGSGRFADELAHSIRAGYSVDPNIQAVLNTNRVHLFSLENTPQMFTQLLLSLGRWST